MTTGSSLAPPTCAPAGDIPDAGAVEADRAETAPAQSRYGWADDYLTHVPFEHLNECLIRFCCDLSTNITRSAEASAALLRSLPRSDQYAGEEAIEVFGRIEAGDPRVITDEPQFFDQEEIAAPFAHLYGYARGGEGPGRSPEEARAQIPILIERHKTLVDYTPVCIRRDMGHSFDWLADTLAAAEARWATDNGLPVTTENLAALAGLKPKTMANLMAAKALPADADGLIPAAAALGWLTGRKDFIPSWWQTWNERPPDPGGGSTNPYMPEHQMFVPIDGDGNPFLPSLARKSRDGVLRYAIGEKATPEYVEDYWEALKRLARMPIPRWRRPNPGGHGGWGLVSAQDGWRRYARADLERMIEAARSPVGRTP